MPELPWQAEYLDKIEKMKWKELLDEVIDRAFLENHWEVGACESRLRREIGILEDELAAFHTLHDMKAVENG